ncbi:arginine--tRNA ligase, cytoplasmic [Tachysurus ichikawai]
MCTKEFQKVYDCLGIRILERGESYYQDMMTEVVKEFEQKANSYGLLESGSCCGSRYGCPDVARFIADTSCERIYF